MFTRSQSSFPPGARAPSHWLSSTRSVTGAEPLIGQAADWPRISWSRSVNGAEPLIGHDADWPRISRPLIGQAAD